MNKDVNVIWRQGDNMMPHKAKYVVEAAQGELLLKTLQLPEETINAIKYNADKSAQSISDYVAGILVERLQAGVQ
jgi:hypothetical protein